jgi:hypothetical protein
MIPRKKKHVLIVSRKFLNGHPRQGQETNFADLIKERVKIHTIRMNFDHWTIIKEKVNNGEALLSIRYWTGRPYGSPQQEIMVLEKFDVQKVYISPNHTMVVDGRELSEKEALKLMYNDGLTRSDFKGWFPKGTTHEGAIIHFTDLKY